MGDGDRRPAWASHGTARSHTGQQTKPMKKSISLLATLAALAPCLPATTNAATQIYDLKADWSDTQNPNGAWSYREGTNLLHSVAYGPDLRAWIGLNNYAPVIYRELDLSSVTVENSCPSCGQGIANILWTAPSAGTIEISGAVWDSFSLACSERFWALSRNGNPLSGGQFTCGDHESILFPFYFSSGSGGPGVLQNIPVAAGDQVVLEIGYSFGLLGGLGVNFTITFTEGSVDPVTAIEDLAETVVAMNLQNGIENSLDSKLDAAINALIDANFNNDGAACNSLAAFISAVEAQRGNKITSAQADQLNASAQQIRGMLNCGN